MKPASPSFDQTWTPPASCAARRSGSPSPSARARVRRTAILAPRGGGELTGPEDEDRGAHLAPVALGVLEPGVDRVAGAEPFEGRTATLERDSNVTCRVVLAAAVRIHHGGAGIAGVHLDDGDSRREGGARGDVRAHRPRDGEARVEARKRRSVDGPAGSPAKPAAVVGSLFWKASRRTSLHARCTERAAFVPGVRSPPGRARPGCRRGRSPGDVPSRQPRPPDSHPVACHRPPGALYVWTHPRGGSQAAPTFPRRADLSVASFGIPR